MTFNARDLPDICRKLPPEAGEALAEHFLQTSFPEEVDLRDLPPGLLISGFFNGFFQRVHDKEPAKWPLAQAIEWKVLYSFQKERITWWVKSFRPWPR